MQPEDKHKPPVSRRDFVGVVLTGSGALAVLPSPSPGAAVQTNGSIHPLVPVTLNINQKVHTLTLDARVTLLDLLREQLHLTGTKKGCDHGQCGACTVLVNGRRINSCLALAVMHDGDAITTIEGLEQEGKLHPMQAAFIEHDGLQCGYCTPGQICSALAVLTEVKQNQPSAVTANLASNSAVELTDDEIRERMSGNICRCGAYAGIVAAVRSVHQGGQA